MKNSILLITLFVLSVGYAKEQVAIFGGGCFWCMESDFDKLVGVKETISGYDGGNTANPTYQYVSKGKSGYVEVVKIIYNPEVLTYDKLLAYYWQHVDPTTKDAQFCDKGSQYKTVIFYLDTKQKKIALASKVILEKLFKNKDIYTEILPSTSFYPAEEYHQNYYKKHSYRYKYYRWNCGRDKIIKEVWNGKQLK